MTRQKFTSPGVLLILAIIACGCILLLDPLYLRPYVESQKWDALRDQAMRSQSAARLILKSKNNKPVDGTTLEEMGVAAGGEVTFMPSNPAHDELRLHGEDLWAAWPAENAAGKDIGWFQARIPVGHVLRQAAVVRRMTLILVSLATGLAMLVIVGTHMLVTGPIIRLMKRLSEVEEGHAGASQLARDLHGEPLLLARRLESAFDRLSKISKTDQLTGLANRRHFEEVLKAFYHQARRYNRPLSVMVMDLDFLKAVNDTGGHIAGDALLKDVAVAIERICRKADLPARLGGDEFAALLPETNSRDAMVLAERIRTAVAARPIEVKGVKMGVTASIGVSDLNCLDIGGPEAMMQAADRALYAAKTRGRNRVVMAHDLEATDQRQAVSESREVDKLCSKLAGLDTQFKEVFIKGVREMLFLLEQRDPHMVDHARKVQHYSVLIAREMGLPDRVVKRVQIAAMLHDIGMLVMPDSILLCAGQLNEEQTAMMRRHPLLSVRIMEGMEFMEQEIPAVRYHHERFDGKGYPEGLANSQIPLSARIIAVADAFDAMITPRAFRAAMTVPEALTELHVVSGAQLDPGVVEAFMRVAARLGEHIAEIPGAAGVSWVEQAVADHAHAVG